MRPRVLAILALALSVFGGLLLVLWLPKTITLQVDGRPSEVTTLKFTVGGLLRQEGVDWGMDDLILPAPSSWLREGETIQVAHAATILLFADGEQYTLHTAERIPANILALARVPLYPGDQIWMHGVPIPASQPLPYASEYRLQVRRAHVVTIREGGGAIYRLKTTAPTLGAALEEAGLVLRLADRLTPSPATRLTDDLEANLQRAKKLTIQIGTQSLEAFSAASTVGQALAEVGMPLQGLDVSQPAAEEPLPEDGAIRIQRVYEEVLLEQEVIPFTTQYQPLPDLEIDQQAIVQPGTYGLTVRRVRVRYAGDQEMARLVEAEWTAQTPKPRIIGYGTQINVRTVQTPDGPLEYWRAVRMYATSFSPCRLGIPDYCNDQTYSGEKVRKGLAAVVRRWYPSMAGRQVYVPGYGTATIADIGAGIPGRYWIDLAYPDDEYVSWHQWVTVYFLTPIPPTDQILWILP
jgi:uncharacterized protein YabE (DUF348 family)